MFSYSEISLSLVFLSEIYYKSFHSIELYLNTLTVFTCSSLPLSKRMEDLQDIKYEYLKDKCLYLVISLILK